MEDQITVNGRVLSIRRLLGKGKGGYSYLAADERGEYVVKQIHHEPCEYYQFGDKLAAEQRDYERLLSAGIPMPRLMDVGQCNDAYSAIQIALALANAFGCGVNELPLSMVLSWYEQKAVCILLTLLHLGIRNIRLGPTLPAFLSPNVLNYLVDNFGIAPITTPESDLKQLLK